MPGTSGGPRHPPQRTKHCGEPTPLAVSTVNRAQATSRRSSAKLGVRNAVGIGAWIWETRSGRGRLVIGDV
jgi:hypothetical protein